MRQLFLEKGSVVVKEVSQPLLDDYLVLVAVHYSFISSGTETATIANAKAPLLTNVPYKIKKVIESITTNGLEATKALIKGKLVGDVQALGYSCSGQVIAVGKQVKQLRAGDYVACAGAGYANHADFVCVPEHLLVKISSKEHVRAASITTIGAIALQGIRRANVQLGEFVCVIGLGLLGQLTVQLAKMAGATVIGIDLVKERLELARKLGADVVFDGSQQTVVQEIAALTHHQGIDSTLITAASKSHAIVQQAMEITRKKGKVVIVGDVGLSLERDPFYKKEIDFLISCSYGPGRYDNRYEQQGNDYPYAYVRWTENRNMQAVLQLIEQGKLRTHELITQEATLDTVGAAYEQLKDKKTLGVILSYGVHHEEAKIEPKMAGAIKTPLFKPATLDTLRVGIIGAGGFAKVKLLPLIAKIDKTKINAVVDADITNAMNVSKLYGAARALTGDYELFDHDLVDVVVIASPHKFHCDQALRALQQGKAVFMEKPMVTSQDQYTKLSTFLASHPQARFCVDYNRSYAPYIQKIKQAVAARTSPLMIHYRMNAGFIPKEHWIQTEVGAGRIIGEACHIIDLFCYLTDSKPISVSVEALHGASLDIFPTDNFSAQITFHDGSVCTLLYTALGHAQLGKERMELFYDSKSIVLDDYTTLQGFGLARSFSTTTRYPDKGHEALLTSFFAAIKQPTFVPPISFERLTTAANLTLMIDALACEGGGTQHFTLDEHA